MLYLGRLHAVQKGIKIDSKSSEGKSFLLKLMDQLEKVQNILRLSVTSISNFGFVLVCFSYFKINLNSI